MPAAPVPPAVEEFLKQPNNCVIATLRPDGSPHTTATWYDWDGSRILVNLDEIRPRLKWMRHDGRVALTMVDPQNFYRHISIMGRVAEIVDDPERVDIDRLSQRYVGKPYPRRKLPRVSVWIEVERWHGWDRSPNEPAGGITRERLPL
ncbi:MAG: PPOX class F420-dependent oxidoreductase [Thermoleophilia bacterium]|nr:PPOX class F420-dependent oxidoreductase [Thermoleophilia bacterium]